MGIRYKKFSWVDSVPSNQISDEFVQGMLNRMIHGYHKYGHVLRSVDKPDSIQCLRMRLKEYRKTGNTEWLIDAANYAMMEFMAPRHRRAHFRATRSDESPGAVLVGGKHVQGKRDMPASLVVERRSAARREGD
jgi:hypothetical protein